MSNGNIFLRLPFIFVRRTNNFYFFDNVSAIWKEIAFPRGVALLWRLPWIMWIMDDNGYGSQLKKRNGWNGIRRIVTWVFTMVFLHIKTICWIPRQNFILMILIMYIVVWNWYCSVSVFIIARKNSLLLSEAGKSLFYTSMSH